MKGGNPMRGHHRLALTACLLFLPAAPAQEAEMTALTEKVMS